MSKCRTHSIPDPLADSMSAHFKRRDRAPATIPLFLRERKKIVSQRMTGIHLEKEGSSVTAWSLGYHVEPIKKRKGLINTFYMHAAL